MSLDMYFDREGQPLELFEWADLFERRDYRVVRQTPLGNYGVSTVWIGLSSRMGEPLGTFETAIFKDGGILDELFRLDTQGEAVRWHLWVCSVVVKYNVKQLGPGSKVTPSTDRGPAWQVVIATTDGQLVIVPVPSGLTLSSGRK
jgi:hypothetical protein